MWKFQGIPGRRNKLTFVKKRPCGFPPKWNKIPSFASWLSELLFVVARCFFRYPLALLRRRQPPRGKLFRISFSLRKGPYLFRAPGPWPLLLWCPRPWSVAIAFPPLRRCSLSWWGRPMRQKRPRRPWCFPHLYSFLLCWQLSIKGAFFLLPPLFSALPLPLQICPPMRCALAFLCPLQTRPRLVFALSLVCCYIVQKNPLWGLKKLGRGCHNPSSQYVPKYAPLLRLQTLFQARQSPLACVPWR